MLNPDSSLFPDEIGKVPEPQKTPWLLLAVLVLLVGLGIWVTNRPAKAPLSAKQEGSVRANIGKQQEQVNIDTSRARHVEESATELYKTGQAYATIATFHHKQSKPHATPISVSDSAAERLQRYLSNY